MLAVLVQRSLSSTTGIYSSVITVYPPLCSQCIKIITKFSNFDFEICLTQLAHESTISVNCSFLFDKYIRNLIIWILFNWKLDLVQTITSPYSYRLAYCVWTLSASAKLSSKGRGRPGYKQSVGTFPFLMGMAFMCPIAECLNFSPPPSPPPCPSFVGYEG